MPVVGALASFLKLTVTEVPVVEATEVGARAKDFEPSAAVTMGPPPALVALSTLNAAIALPVRVAVGGVAVVPGLATTVRVPVLVAGAKEMGVNWIVKVQNLPVVPLPAPSSPWVRQVLPPPGTREKSGTTAPVLSTTLNPSTPLFSALMPFVIVNWNVFAVVDKTG
jgi:hypothetical protein